MKIKLTDIINFSIFGLFYLTPVLYVLAKLTSNSMFWAFKDLLMYLIFFEICGHLIYKGIRIQRHIFLILILFFLVIFVSSIVHLEDTLFWFIGFREMFVNPLIFITMGYYLSTESINYNALIAKSVAFTCILTVVFALLVPSLSYGLTGRLSSFWDREHEPAIIGGLAMVMVFLKQPKYNRVYSLLIMVSGLFCLIASESRSALIALFLAILYIFANKISIKNILFTLATLILAILFFNNFSSITHRSLDYNLIARTQQYSLALNLIKKHFLFGIGIDKYGVLGSNIKILSYGGLSTITMDSSLLKYFVNLGSTYLFFFFGLIYYAYKNSRYTKYFSVIVFSLVMGMFTGKLGAYPLNLYFYVSMGYLLCLERTTYETK